MGAKILMSCRSFIGHNNSIIKIVIITTTVLTCLISRAQQGPAVAGNTSVGIGGTFSFSLGLVDFVSIDNNTNAGLQQAYSANPLPIFLLSFTAVKQGKYVLLHWEASNEMDTDSFVVQHSFNGTNFRDIGFMLAVGANGNKYVLEDKGPNDGINYYRLKQILKDGRFIYSAVATINFETSISISCYPNPANGFFNIDIGTGDLRFFSYHLFDMGGKSIKTGSISSRVTRISTEHLDHGSYVIRVLNKQQTSASFVIIRN
jgi:hypothetical protein